MLQHHCGKERAVRGNRVSILADGKGGEGRIWGGRKRKGRERRRKEGRRRKQRRDTEAAGVTQGPISPSQTPSPKVFTASQYSAPARD